DALAELGVAADRLRVVPHPVFPSDPPRADDGRTLLCLGVIRPYKGLGDAIEAVKRLDGARLLVAGDPMEPVDGYRARAGARRAREELTWDRSAAAHLELYGELT